MKLKIQHHTEYSFDGPQGYALQQLRVRPMGRPSQTVNHWDVRVEGGNLETFFNDHHRNPTDLVSVNEGSDKVTIISEGEVITSETHGVTGPHIGFAPLWLYLRETALTAPGPSVKTLIENSGCQEIASAVDRLHCLSTFISEQVPYEIGQTDAKTTAEDALIARRGVCQDHAHIFVSAARQLGYPARYVGGYLMMNDRVDQDAGHAWAEAYVDGLGWLGFDVSNGISPDERYVCVAVGLDYLEAAPISGITVGKGGDQMSVNVQVQQ